MITAINRRCLLFISGELEMNRICCIILNYNSFMGGNFFVNARFLTYLPEQQGMQSNYIVCFGLVFAVFPVDYHLDVHMLAKA
jgi:hypothetical protein